MASLLYHLAIAAVLKSNHLHVYSCVATVSPDDAGITTTTITTTTTAVDCNAFCPSIYSNNCNGNLPAICATSSQASAMVVTTGTECRQTWMCPAGTSPFYYTSSNPAPQAYPGTFARCFPPNNVWFLPDGVTQITGLACQS